MSDERPILTIPEVADILGIGESTAYKMAREGEIPALRVRSLLRVRRQALDDYILRQEQLQTELQTNRRNPFATARRHRDRS